MYRTLAFVSARVGLYMSLIVASVGMACYGQIDTGSIVGIVRDASGAVLIEGEGKFVSQGAIGAANDRRNPQPVQDHG